MIGLRANPASIASLSTEEDIVQTFKESVKAEDKAKNLKTKKENINTDI